MKSKIYKVGLPVLLIILAILSINFGFIIRKIANKNQFANNMIQIAQANQEPIFQVSKIIKYSSADAIDNTAEQNLQDLSIQQYSDIAIYIDNLTDELTEKNSVKELYLDNFKVQLGYQYGTPTLYYKNPLEISKYRKIDENQIQDSLTYNIIYTNEQNEESNYEKPTFFADCSNPICTSSCLDPVIPFIKILSIRVLGKQWEKGRPQAWYLLLVPFGPICWTCPCQ